MPFYKFGDMMFLKKIPTDEWVAFICAKFRETGKVISEEQATRICEATENLSSYVQHLAWVVWYKSDKVVANKDVSDAIDDLLEQNKVFFQREVEQLSEHQLNYLRALANGATSGFSRKEVIKKYRLESSANIQSVNNHEYDYAVGAMFTYLISECEKLGDYVVNVVEARIGQ
jgi:hypothetical protein